MFDECFNFQNGAAFRGQQFRLSDSFKMSAFYNLSNHLLYLYYNVAFTVKRFYKRAKK